MARKKVNKNTLSPVITMLILIFIVSIFSYILSLINVSASETSIVNGKLENSIILVENIFSKNGMKYLLLNMTSNFNMLEPLILLILSLISFGILKSSGFLKHIFKPLKKLKPQVMTFMVVLLGVVSTLIGDYSYIILIPLVAILYEYLGKSPVLGIVTIFLGITLGYGTGLFYNYNDYALGMLTQNAAVIDVDATYKYNLFSNLYIMIASTIAISFLITMLIDKYLSKKVSTSEPIEDELIISKKALLMSLIPTLVAIVLIIIMMLPNGILLDSTQTEYIAKIFSSTSPFNSSFMILFLIVSSISGITYGLISKNFKNNHEIGWGYTKYLNNVGYIFVLLFLASILISIINWTNMGTVLAIKLLTFINSLGVTGIPLIIVSFVSIILMCILIPGSLEKWSLISPILVPVFMRGNLTPDFAQFVFKAADSVGKVITPLFIYFIIMVGFIQKYNTKENKVTLFNTMKLIWPIIIAMIIFWLLILIIWYIAGLPLGIDTLATM